MPKNDEPEDEFDDIDLDLLDDDEPPRPVITGRVVVYTLLSLVASCGMMLAARWRTLGAMRFYTPAESIVDLRELMAAGFIVIILGANALRVTRPFEGSPFRAAAVVSSAISFVAEMLLGTSLYELIKINNP